MTAPLDPPWASSSSFRMPFTVFPCLELPFVSVINIEHLWYALKRNHSRNIIKRQNPFPQGTDCLVSPLFPLFLSFLHLHPTYPPNFTSGASVLRGVCVCVCLIKKSLCVLWKSIAFSCFCYLDGFLSSVPSVVGFVCLFLMFFWLTCFWRIKGLEYKLSKGSMIQCVLFTV